MEQAGQFQVLRKDDFDHFVSRLAGLGTLVAPVAGDAGTFSFREVLRADELAVEHVPTILPPKKYFLPPRETLLEYDLHQGKGTEGVCRCRETILFGVHTCDLLGIHCLNMVALERPRDFNYLLRRRKLTVIGIECGRYCDGHAACAMAGAHLPAGGYDLFFTDIGDSYVVHVSTQRGDDIGDAVNLFYPAGRADLDALAALRESKRGTFLPEVPLDPRTAPGIFAASFDHPVWDDLGTRCLACGTCTMVCPTCSCFDVRDELRADLKRGRRIRTWDSCQNETFAAVAGGENFRPLRGQRQRHRVYRKFSYPVEKYHRWFCTGCGRCSRSCMAGIRLKETLADLAGGKGP